jgi:transcriptional regulator with XRE-family HTH domain
MATVSSEPAVGPLVREWRDRRRLTQDELASKAGIPAAELGVIEAGDSQPERDILLRILEQLDVPFREQNRLLQAAGHHPPFPERPYANPELGPVRAAVERILSAHDPYPGVAVDRAWNLVAANATVKALAEGVDVDPALLEPPVNVLRVALHPRGLAPRLVNLDECRAHFQGRLESQLARTGDEDVAALLEEIDSYPGPEHDATPVTSCGPSEMLGLLRMRSPYGELAFFGMLAVFDTPVEVTSAELAIVLLFPAERGTADALEELAEEL